ncbi:hypothetical protein ACHAO4_009050 [Trichoderma viride]
MASAGDARLMKSTKFPAEFSQKVDMQKVNLQVIKKWIANRISEILGNEDDVVIEMCFNLIEGPRHPDIKSLQIQLTGFLDKETAPFCKELWKLLLSAQGNPQGVPKELLEAKKLELMQEKIEADKAAENARKRREDTDRRDREVTELKDRDRRDRANERGGRPGRRGDRASEGRGRGGHNHVLPKLDTVLLGTRIVGIAMCLQIAAAGDAIVAGRDGEAARHLSQRLSDHTLEAATCLAATGALEVLHGAKAAPVVSEIREKDLGPLAEMLIDQDGNRETVEIVVTFEIDAQLLQSAPHLHQSEGGSLPPGVDQSSDEDVTRRLHPLVRGVLHKRVAAVLSVDAIDPRIAPDQTRLQSADENAEEVAALMSLGRIMTTDAAAVIIAAVTMMKPQQRARNLKG